MAKQLDQQVTFIGAGAIADALVRGLIESGVIAANSIRVYDRFQDRPIIFADKYGIHAFDDLSKALLGTDVVFFCVKPKDIEDALHDAAKARSSWPLFLSVVAGCPLSFLLEGIAGEQADTLASIRFVRAMPNTSSAVLTSATAFSASAACTEDDIDLVKQLLNAVGTSYLVDESLLNAVTALSGSGPAYFYYMVEAMIEAGVGVGFSEELATQLTLQTLYGSAKMLENLAIEPGVLRKNVTSPGGTTMAGIAALDAHGFKEAIRAGVIAARDRAIEMGTSYENKV